LTGDYRIILPLMLSVVLSTLVSEALSRDTIYTLKLRRRGIDLRAGRDIDLMGTVPVAQAMSTLVPAVSPDLSAAEAAEQLEQTGGRALLIIDEQGVIDGIATLRDLETALMDNQPGLRLAGLASRPVVTVYPDEPLSEAVHKMGVRDVGQLPVVARGAIARVIGMLHRVDVVRAYSRAMLDRLETQTHRPVPRSELRGTRVVQVSVDPGGRLVGKTLAELHLPGDMLVIGIDRQSETIIPRGDSELRPGDRLEILVRNDAIGALHEHLASGTLTP